MGFERVENMSPVSAAAKGAVPVDGARWQVRTLARSAVLTQFINLSLGAVPVRKLGLPKQPVVMVALAFDTGADAGKLAISVDAKGDFAVRWGKTGTRLTISAATADGLFALTPGLACDVADVPVTCVMHQTPRGVITLPAAAWAED